MKMTRSRTRLSLIISLIAVLIVSGLVSTGSAGWLSLQDESWRKQPPRPGPPRPFNLPASREARLGNGLTLVIVEDHRAPIATIEIGIPLMLTPYGDLNSFTHQVALAEATAELITEGAGLRTSEQLAREIETIGGRIASSANDDFAEVTASVISENIERMIDLIGDALLRPTFPQKEIALYKNNRVESLAVERQDPAFLVRERFNHVVYGSHHPYAVIAPTPEAVRAITRTKLLNFYRNNYTPSSAVIVIAGDFDATKIEAKLRMVFGKWKEPRRAIAGGKIQAMPKPTARRVYLIDRPGSEQADFRIGGLAVARAHADFFPLMVANAVLGAGTGSRLFLNVREKKGYTYDVSSTVSAFKEAGTFFASSETRAEATLAAIKEMLAELDRLRNEKVGMEELQNAKNYLTGLFSLELSTQGGIADQMIQARLFGLGADYLKTYRALIEAVTADQVQAVARKYMMSDNATIVVVGDAAKLRKDLSTLGPVELFDTQGKRMK